MDDSTDDDIDLMDKELMEGDFVVVKVAGKSRVLNFIARVDVFDDLEGCFFARFPEHQTGQHLC